MILFGKSVDDNTRSFISIGCASLVFIVVGLMGFGFAHNRVEEISMFPIADGINFAFKGDKLGFIFGITSSFLWIMTSIYSKGYMDKTHSGANSMYHGAFALCMGATMGICFAENLLVFFVFFEILTISTYPLVVFKKDEESKLAGRKYLIYTLTSGQFLLVAMVILYGICGSLVFQPGGFANGKVIGEEGFFIFVMMVSPGLVKAGVMPFHSWLPSAMVAPTPVSALLHAVAVVKAGAFLIIRVVGFVFGPEEAMAVGGTNFVGALAIITILVASFIAIKKENLKERLAYSTISQLSYIVLGISMISIDSFGGGIFHILAHGMLKIILFMCVGIVYCKTGKTKINEIQGLGKTMPITFGIFTVGALGMIGLPFMAVFLSKLDIIEGSIIMGNWLAIITLVISSLMSVVYLLTIPLKAFEGTGNINIKITREGSAPLMIPIIITSIMGIILGVVPDLGLHIYSMSKEIAVLVINGGLGL